MTQKQWRNSFRPSTNTDEYFAHPNSPAGGTGTGYSRRPGGGYEWDVWPSQIPHPESPAGKTLDWHSRDLDSSLGKLPYAEGPNLLHLVPQVVLRFALQAGAAAQKGGYKEEADKLREISFGMNVTGTSLILMGLRTGGITVAGGEVLGTGAAFVDLAAGILYLADGSVRGNRGSFLNGGLSIAYVFLDVATDNVGALVIKKAAHGSRRLVFKSTGRYISYRVGAGYVIWRKFLQGEVVDQLIDLTTKKYANPKN